MEILTKIDQGPRVMRDCGLGWTVALEAALFFSIPSWALTDRGWPSDRPYQFAAAVFLGASAALVLCHVLPAFGASTISELVANRVGRIILWPVGAWFCAGAAASLGQVAHLSGSMCVLYRDAPWQDEPTWQIVAIVVALLFVLVPMVVAWQPILRQRPVIALCLVLGVCLAITAFSAQLAGLRTKNPHMMSEVGLSDPFGVSVGMLMAAAPATILALRIGRMGLSSRRTWWTGVGGVWLPLVASVTLLSLAKMCGVRLYWRPSMPIGHLYAFAWLFQGPDAAAKAEGLNMALWPHSLTILAPCLICAVWIKELAGAWRWGWQKLLTFTGLAAATYWLMSPDAWSLYNEYWLRSIIFASLVLGGARLFLRHRQAISGTGR